jgi:hypothetical protein
MPDVPFEGIKIQLKGRMSGKGGMASKKVWVWGRTGRNAVDDPVDYAHEAVVTRAGYIGIKVRAGGGLGQAAESGQGGCIIMTAPASRTYLPNRQRRCGNNYEQHSKLACKVTTSC